MQCGAVPIPWAAKRRFLRYIYANGGASEATRSAYIATFCDAAVASLGNGRRLVSTSAGGHSVSYQLDTSWTLQDIYELCEWAESYIAPATITLALAEVPARVTSFQTNTTNLHVLG
jgi:hypothetical protein